MLQVENVNFAYERDKVLTDISFKIEKGSITAIFGPNGSGKTTAIKCIARLLNFSTGDIFVEEKNLKSMSVKQISRTLAYVPQEHKPFFPYLVSEMVLMGRTPYLGGMEFSPSKSDTEESLRAIERIGITHIKDKPYTQLSGGERQLVILARAIAQNPQVLLLDEPALNLDFKNQIKIWELLRSLSLKERMTILVSTHDPNHVLWFCDRVILLNKGKILSSGMPTEVLTNQNLETLYGPICKIEMVNGKNIVLPKN